MYINASCHLFDIAPLQGAVEMNMPFSIDILPLRGMGIVCNPFLNCSKLFSSNSGYITNLFASRQRFFEVSLDRGFSEPHTFTEQF